MTCFHFYILHGFCTNSYIARPSSLRRQESINSLSVLIYHLCVILSLTFYLQLTILLFVKLILSWPYIYIYDCKPVNSNFGLRINMSFSFVGQIKWSLYCLVFGFPFSSSLLFPSIPSFAFLYSF